MKSTNITHQLYAELVQAQLTVLEELERIVSRYALKRAQALLATALQEHSLLPSESLNYPRLYALLKKNLAGEDLSREDFRGMPLDDFIFANAVLDHALFDEASLRRANFCESHLAHASFRKASCQKLKANGAYLYAALLVGADWSKATCHGAKMGCVDAREAILTEADFEAVDLSHADLRQVDLSDAKFSYCNLEKIHLEGANLSHCQCATSFFGKTLCFDMQTTIDPNNHTLISMVLLSRASTVEEEKFALYIRHRTSLCWPGFTRLLIRQREFAPWVKDVLGSITSLSSYVVEYEELLRRLLTDEENHLDLDDIHPQLHQLLCSQIERHTSLPNPDLHWYLQGILEMAYQQPGIQLDEQQKQEIQQRLRAFTNMPND